MKIKNPIWKKLIDEYGLKTHCYDVGYNIWSGCYEYKPGSFLELLRISEDDTWASFYVATELYDYSNEKIIVLTTRNLNPIKSYEYAKEKIDTILKQVKECKEKFALERIKEDF